MTMVTVHTEEIILKLSKKSHFENLTIHKIHNFKVSLFTKFTFLKSHFSQNSQFQNIIFHKIHIFICSNQILASREMFSVLFSKLDWRLTKPAETIPLKVTFSFWFLSLTFIFGCVVRLRESEYSRHFDIYHYHTVTWKTF